MKYIFLLPLSCAVVTTIIYGIGAFITWDINPGNWSEPARFFASIMWIVGSYFAMYASVLLTKK